MLSTEDVVVAGGAMPVGRTNSNRSSQSFPNRQRYWAKNSNVADDPLRPPHLSGVGALPSG